MNDHNDTELWTAEKRTQFRIGLLELWASSCNLDDIFGRSFHWIFDCYIRHLKTVNITKGELSDCIQRIEDVFEHLLDEPSMAGWSYGARPTNQAQGLASILIQIKVALSLALTAKIIN